MSVDRAGYKCSVSSDSVLGNDVTVINAELSMHTVETICRNVSVGLCTLSHDPDTSWM